jgi:Cdc6-like AAA superfamily ATPase
MFARKEKPLPKPVFEIIEKPPVEEPKADEGIYLGDNCYWNPQALPNGHIVAIGASGSGKTQTLKAITHELRQTYPNIQVIVIDFHGDQQIDGGDGSSQKFI